MKIRIEIDKNFDDDEVIIKCRELNKNIQSIQNAIADISANNNMVFYKNQVEYFLPINSIMFFETSDNSISAHTANDVYQIKNRLYELEEILPNNFVRVSKSTILNVNHIYSIDKNLTSSSIVKFSNTHKQVYVSRNYYKFLRQRLDERRNYET